MAHRVKMYSNELNAINNVKWNKQKCNSIIDEGGMELVNCICDCAANVLKGDIPITDDEKQRLERHKNCLRKLIKRKTSDKERKHLVQEGGFLGALAPILAGLVGKLFTG